MVCFDPIQEIHVYLIGSDMRGIFQKIPYENDDSKQKYRFNITEIIGVRKP